MDKLWISILFLVLLYFVKILTDYKGFNNDPNCFNLYEKLQASKTTYFVAIPLSYIYCLVGAYDKWIENLFCADLIYFFLISLGVVIPVILISIQNKENNGIANSFSDMSGAVFFISTVTEASIFLVIYAIVFIIILLFYVIKCEKEDNCILHKVIAIGVATALLVLPIFSDKIVSVLFSFGFTDHMLYYSILMFLSETLIPPISEKITTLLYNKFKTNE